MNSASESVRALVDAALFGFLERRRAALPDAVVLLDELTRVASAGGKRLRPAFCVWGYRAGGGADDAAIGRAGASLELLHTFAIIHDDVMDRSPLRRGADATHVRLGSAGGPRTDGARFGESAAILVGDLAMALADELWSSSGFERVPLAEATAAYHAMRAEVIGGQFLDLLAAARGHATPEEARRISVLKSGRYTVERPLEIGAALAGADPDLRKGLARFGAPLGEAFQLRDDLLGAFGDPSVTGKDSDGDLREGKQTLLVALARREADAGDREALDRLLGAPGLDAGGAAQVREIFVRTGARDQVVAAVQGLVADANAALADASIPAVAAEALIELATDAARVDV